MKLKDILITRDELDNIPAKDRDKIQCLKLLNILEKHRLIDHDRMSVYRDKRYKWICQENCSLCKLYKTLGLKGTKMDIPKDCKDCCSKYACPWVKGTPSCRLRLEQHDEKERRLKSQESLHRISKE